MKKRLLLSSIIVMALAGCQTLEGFRKKDEAPETPSASKVTSAGETIWVDLTPYEKVHRRDAPDTVELVSESASDEVITSWGVELEDGTVRKTISRWAKQANWTFSDDNYEMDEDAVIIADATLVEQGTFKDAIETLVEAVALSDNPIRACFYQNNILRIISHDNACRAQVEK